MIDINKKYRTVCGHDVVGLQRVEFNSAGNRVTFPIKGSIKIPGKRSLKYEIWNEQGKCKVFGDSKFDLVEKD